MKTLNVRLNPMDHDSPSDVSNALKNSNIHFTIGELNDNVLAVEVQDDEYEMAIKRLKSVFNSDQVY